MSTAETLDVPVGVSPLSSRTIVVTRPKAQAAELADSLKALGADVRLIPTIAIEPPSDPAPLEFAARGETVYDWVIFTSANGVGALREAADRAGIGLGRVVGVGRVCCIGPATARAAEGAGLVVSVIPYRYSAEALVETLEATTALAGARVLLPLADGARDVLPAELRRRGTIVDAVTAYQTVPVTRVGGEASSDLLNGVDMVTFASPSAVRGFHALINGRAVIPVAVIGPITASTARDLGYDVTVQAEEFTVVGLVEAILRHYMDERS